MAVGGGTARTKFVFTWRKRARQHRARLNRLLVRSGGSQSTDLLKGVNIGLGSVPMAACLAFDPDRDGQVTVSELITAVNEALDGCL